MVNSTVAGRSVDGAGIGRIEVVDAVTERELTVLILGFLTFALFDSVDIVESLDQRALATLL